MFKTEIGAIRAINTNILFEDSIFDNWRNNKNVVKKAISVDSRAFKWASDELRNDKELCLNTYKIDDRAVDWASKEIQELCKDEDPIKTLESVIIAEKLQTALSQKQEQKPGKKFKI